MDEIKQIQYHENAAEMPEGQASYHKWWAAKLIAEVVDSGTSQRELGQQLGKSNTHVRYMYRSWNLVGRKLYVSGNEEMEGMPNFSTVYNSDEVRGRDGEALIPVPEVEKAERTGDVGGGYTENDIDDDPTAAGMVRAIARAAMSLRRSEALKDLLTDEDYALLGESYEMIAEILSLPVRK